MIFDELSNAACRLSLGGPGAELEGGVFKHPPRLARVTPSTGPARVNGYSFDAQLLFFFSFRIGDSDAFILRNHSSDQAHPIKMCEATTFCPAMPQHCPLA